MTTKFHDWATAEITAQLGWTLLHFVWQGTLIAICTAFLLWATRRRSAQVRYLMACTALALMAASPLATFAWCHYERQATAAASVVASVPEPNQQIGQEPPPVAMPGPTIPSSIEANVPPDDLLAIAPAPSVAHPEPLWIRAQRQFEPYVPWLVALWLCGVALLSLRLVCGWHWIYRLSHSTHQGVPEPLRERLALLAGALSISRPVRLVESVLVEVPTVIGWLRPLILLPSSALMGLTASQLEAILAHELAHIRRHDFLVNVWQTVMETLLFYHPAVWWISHHMRTERELCCDDLAVAICPNRVIYARALAEMESLRAAPRLAVAANGGSLRDRVRRLVSPGTELPRSGGWTASLCALATAVLVCVFAYAGPNAQGHADDAEETAPALSDDVPIDNADVVLKQARPYIVQLKSEKPGGKGGQPIVGLGTGVILDERGYVLTMRHLVEGVSVRVTLADGSTLPAAVVVTADKAQDLALLKIEGTKPFPVATWGNSAIVKVGAAITAIGQEYDRGVVAKQGKITATDRDLEINPEMTYRKLLQMDAEIKPGSSGGPVLNEAGEVVGLCVAIRAGKPVLSFALPIDEVRPVAAKMLAIATGAEPETGSNPESKPTSESRAARPTHGIFRGSIRLVGPLPPVPPPLAKKGETYVGGKMAEDVPDERLLIDRPPDVDLGQGGGTRGIANVAVYLQKAPKIPAEPNDANPPALKVALKDFAFTPRVTPWRVGQPLEFTNNSPGPINIKTFPLRNNPFNFLVPAGETRTVPAPQKAEKAPIQLDSNIFLWLKGYLLILDHPYAAVTNARGEFWIPELPPGDYEFVIWHEQAGFLLRAFKVNIAAGQSSVADLQFEFREAGPWQLVQTQRTETGILAIPTAVQYQVHSLAAHFRAVRGGLSFRRPSALRGLAINDPRVKVLAAQAVLNLDSAEKSRDEAIIILRYLGEMADDLVIAGTRSENPRIAARCCDLLMYRGPKAIAPLVTALESSDEAVRSGAATSLGQTFQPAAVEPLLKALPKEKHPHAIIMALMYLRDPRAIEALQKWTNDPSYGQIATDAIRHIQFGGGGYAWWPPESLPDRLLCRDADTWRGESYGPNEIQRMIRLLSSENSTIASEAALFLGRLHADEAVPALAKGHYGYTEVALAEIASPEAINALFRRLHTPEPFLREATVSALASADRWAAPLLVALLDDRTLIIPGNSGTDGILAFGGRALGKWPDEHRAHAALWQLFANFGLRGPIVNLANGGYPDLLAEIPRVKTWWKTHGNDFLEGKDVPNPNLTMVHSSR